MMNRMEVSEIRRGDGGAQFADADSLADPPRVRAVRLLLCVVVIPITLTGIILPIIGAQGFFEHFRVPYSMGTHAEMLLPQLVSPVLLLLLEGLFGYCAFYGKRIPVWVLVFGLAGAAGMPLKVGYASHDFSHVIFEQCSDVYGDVILTLAGSTALLLITIWLLEIRHLKKLGYVWNRAKAKWRRQGTGARLFLSLLLIVASWVVMLRFLEIL